MHWFIQRVAYCLSDIKAVSGSGKVKNHDVLLLSPFIVNESTGPADALSGCLWGTGGGLLSHYNVTCRLV
jgi:hypothetical protein